MEIEGWKYYNHAAIPTCAPHETPDLTPLQDGSIWKMRGGRHRPLLARWTTDWDINYETAWWYVIKDKPFDISELKAKRRYEINKGRKNFVVKKIDPLGYKEELLDITINAYSSWPKKYRPKVDDYRFKDSISEWLESDVFGAIHRESGELCGYARLIDREDFAEFTVLRVIPRYEKLAINAAMVDGILEYYKNRFDGTFYINDGQRSIRHETAFQDYLEKYFAFRKSYCRLNVSYEKIFGRLVAFMYPFRRMISKKNRIGSLMSGILKMEEINRSNE